MKNKISEAQKRANWKQALANTSIEGHKPRTEYMADVECVIRGDISGSEFIRRCVDSIKDRSKGTNQKQR